MSMAEIAREDGQRWRMAGAAISMRYDGHIDIGRGRRLRHLRLNSGCCGDHASLAQSARADITTARR